MIFNTRFYFLDQIRSAGQRSLRDYLARLFKLLLFADLQSTFRTRMGTGRGNFNSVSKFDFNCKSGSIQSNCLAERF